MKNIKLISGLVCGALMVAATAASASTYSFYQITSNGSTNVANQLVLDVTQSGSDALFKILNNGPTASVVAQVYFDFGATSFFAVPNGINWSASNSTSWDGSTGVLFENGGSPPVLPSGNTVGFSAEDRGSAESPAPQKGAGVGEYVGFLGTFSSGSDFNMLISALDSGDFRVGLHVTGIGTEGQSESYVTAVPLPAAAWLFGSALLGFVSLSNRRKI